MQNDLFLSRLMMVSRKNQIKLLENLHCSYSEALSGQYSEETKEKIKNLLQMIEVVIKSLKKKKGDTKIERIKKRIKKVID